MAGRIANLAPVGSLLAKSKRAPKVTGRKPRERDERHLAAIRALPCLSCEAPPPSEAAHVQMTSAALGKRPGGIGAKRDDCWTLPLCPACHRAQHKCGEQYFWDNVGLNPILAAHSLYTVSPDLTAMLKAWQKMRDGCDV